MKKSIILFLVAVILLTGCSKKEEEISTYPILIAGQEILQSPKKVVALSTSIVEQMVMLGYGARLCVVTDGAEDIPGAKDLPSVGNVNSPDIEVILDSIPDVVIATNAVPSYVKNALETAKIPLVILARSDSLDGTYENMGSLCKLFEGEEIGAHKEEQIRFMGDAMLTYIVDESYNALENRGLENPPMAIWLAAEPMIVATGDTLEGSLLKEMGFLNVAQSYENWTIPDDDEANLIIEYLFYSDKIDVLELALEPPFLESAAVLNNMTFPFDISPFERRSPRMFTEMFSIASTVFPEAITSMPNLVMPVPEEPVVEKSWWEKFLDNF